MAVVPHSLMAEAMVAKSRDTRGAKAWLLELFNV